MRKLLRFMNWPLRAKVAMFLLAACFVPIVIAELLDIAGEKKRLLLNTQNILQARSDQLAEQLDAFNNNYLRAAAGIASFPEVARLCMPGAGNNTLPKVNEVLGVYPVSDSNIRGVAILDTAGIAIAATERPLFLQNLSGRGFVKEALKGKVTISGIFIAEPAVSAIPTLAYMVPIRNTTGKLLGVAAIWVRAKAVWNVMRSLNGLAGPGSFAVLFDQYGIRIGHSYSDSVVFHPGGKLSPALVDSLVSEQRFGPATRQLLEGVSAFPEQFNRSLSASPGRELFHGFGPVDQQQSYGVARRSQTVPWTIFYMLPEREVNGIIAQMATRRMIFAGVLVIAVLIISIWFAVVVLKPVNALARATEKIAAGDLAARVEITRNDELGSLAGSFNTMAARIEAQASALQHAKDELEQRVLERTGEMLEATRRLETEVAERELTGEKLRAQLERLDLLHRITRAIGERQDMKSVFQAVAGSLEGHLQVDFACVCLYDAVIHKLIVYSVGAHSEPLAIRLSMVVGAQVDIDQNGLSACLRGQLVYEPDISEVRFSFAERLANAGLRSVVLAPLLVESKVFGILVNARVQPHSFTSGECEFLKQLSEHVALASHHAELYRSLQQAYEDLRQTQQAVMEQERLRALGQMASGIAHDINNAISPITLYAESVLEHEKGLSERSVSYLRTIRDAIDDVAATVARLREFYRQRGHRLLLSPVDINNLVRQVIELTKVRWSDIPQQKGVYIEARADLAMHLPLVLGAENEIREALTNLVFNAVDAMPDGGMLTIRTKLTGAGPNTPPFVTVEVADTGTGMSEETRRRCLEPFFTTKGERGTGLGLAMVYGIMKRHEAEIDIESVAGAGTTIRLVFRAYTGATETSEQEVGQPAIKPLNILVVDDDPAVLKSLRNILEGDGHTVTAASGGQAGIDSFIAAQQGGGNLFDAVITDLGMPYVDGRKVAAAVKKASPATPVIMLTGWGQRLAAEGDMPTYVDKMLSKPPKLRDLRNALS